ncbi:hypothetical protein GHT07_05295 [Caenimonas koreensis DSM 17982]|uniref:Tc1-like transposase DDE domain-containing protein n=1 Tax=Caenimonas koreensis DSM 17982 TaxID=1121255 RepID=A0A844AQV2_9BURK|nr:hypothetical protein [Caenimonas koreensis DSM 17982]
MSERRHGLLVISTVTNRGVMRWKIFDDELNADISIDFFTRLVKHGKRKLSLILEDLKVHHSKPVRACLAEHANDIEVFYLPSYSPEFKPNELANAGLKQAVTKHALSATCKGDRRTLAQRSAVVGTNHEPLRALAGSLSSWIQGC